MNQLKLKRLAADISQVRLEIKSGVSRYKISQHECDYKELDMHDLKRVERAIQEITEGTEDDQQQ